MDFDLVRRVVKLVAIARAANGGLMGVMTVLVWQTGPAVVQWRAWVVGHRGVANAGAVGWRALWKNEALQ